MDYVTLILGDEFDDALRKALRKVLHQRGAVFVGDTWAVAGSQEIEEVEVTVDGQALRIESETYIGLRLSGPKALVTRIAQEVLLAMHASPQP